MGAELVLTPQGLHQQVCAHQKPCTEGRWDPGPRGDAWDGVGVKLNSSRTLKRHHPGVDGKRLQVLCEATGETEAPGAWALGATSLPGARRVREAKPRGYKVRQTLLIHCTITTISYSCRIRKGYNYNVTCTISGSRATPGIQ